MEPTNRSHPTCRRRTPWERTCDKVKRDKYDEINVCVWGEGDLLLSKDRNMSKETNMLEGTHLSKETHTYVERDPDKYVYLNYDWEGQKKPTSIKRDQQKRTTKKPTRYLMTYIMRGTSWKSVPLVRICSLLSTFMSRTTTKQFKGHLHQSKETNKRKIQKRLTVFMMCMMRGTSWEFMAWEYIPFFSHENMFPSEHQNLTNYEQTLQRRATKETYK